MGHYIPYSRAKNYGAHRCRHVIIKLNGIANEHGAHQLLEEHMKDSEGGWTVEWLKQTQEVKVYSKDEEALTFVSMLSEG